MSGIIDRDVAKKIIQDFLDDVGAREELEVRGWYASTRKFKIGDVPGYLMDHAIEKLIHNVYAQAMVAAADDAKSRIENKIRARITAIIDEAVR
jgi:hypothetical protein